MTFEETLLALQELVGEDVMVGARLAASDDPSPLIALSGELRKAVPAPSLDIMQRLGRAAPEDEALQFHVGGTDEPAEKNYFVLRKGTFAEASQDEGAFGEGGLYIVAGGLSLTITARDAAERHVPRA
jgi:hypothetical protein